MNEQVIIVLLVHLQVIAFLEKGRRLHNPEKCPHYEVMLDCWQLEAEKRPTFRWLLGHFNRNLESGSLRIASVGSLDLSSTA